MPMQTLSHIVLALYLLVIACKEVDEFIPVHETLPFVFSKEVTHATDPLS